MADPKGFLRHPRQGPDRRPVAERVRDWHEVYLPFPRRSLVVQATRCMDCGIPFCHEGCPLGNLIPEWNDLVRRERFPEAAERLHATNNFPELTGRLCPAPCEGACVLGISSDPVLIKQVEYELAEWAAGEGLEPVPPSPSTGRSVAVVGSGPSGLAAAQQLTRAGHRVVVFERAERIGGLLRYGVPEFKLEKAVIDRRLAQMVAEGTELRTGTVVGLPGSDAVAGAAAPAAAVLDVASLRDEFDAVVLAVGSTRPRDLAVPGRELAGVHFAMEYLKGANLVCEGNLDEAPITAAGKHVVIIGGGDTGADCLGTAHRQGAAVVHQLEILPEPPATRPGDNPWPTWPLVLRSSAAHEEGGERLYAVSTTELVGDADGRVAKLRAERVELVRGGRGTELRPVDGPPLELRAELVLLALGFVGPERGVVEALGCTTTGRGTIEVDGSFATGTEGVFACGDAARGQSLVVWAIAEGRSAAASVDRYLMGSTDLPAPLRAGSLAWA